MKKPICLMYLIFSLVNANASPGQLKFQLGLLIWHASQENSSIWANEITFPQPNTTIFAPKNIEFSNKAGFRANVMFIPEGNLADVSLRWTDYKTASSQNLSPGFQAITPEYFSGFLSGDIFLAAKQKWDLTLNLFEVDLGHPININESLSIRPAVGIAAASIRQKINARWNALIYVSNERVKHNFSGIGPDLGVSSTWHLSNHFDLLSNLNANFFWGRWNVNDRYQRPTALLGLITPTTITTKFRDSQLGTIMFNYFLGFEFASVTHLPVKLQLGYEVQYWTNQLRIASFQQLPLHGDLTLQGLTCVLHFD